MSFSRGVTPKREGFNHLNTTLWLGDHSGHSRELIEVGYLIHMLNAVSIDLDMHCAVAWAHGCLYLLATYHDIILGV